MNAISEDARNIVFYQKNDVAGKLTYARRHLYKASLTDNEHKVYDIAPVNFWKTKFEVNLNQLCLFNIHLKWTGTSKISSPKISESQMLTFKRKGFINGRYVLQDKDDRVLAEIKSKFKWKGFRHDFNIEISDSLKKRDNYFVVIVMMVYLIRIIARQSGYAASVGAMMAAIT